MRIGHYLLVLAPLALIGCVAEPTPVTTTTTTREVTTTGPGAREVVVTQAPPAVRFWSYRGIHHLPIWRGRFVENGAHSFAIEPQTESILRCKLRNLCL